MKLLRLKLNSDFRSLAAGFEVHFLREWDHERCFAFNPYCLAGRNGSGKSNVLEALAAIFYHIECIYLDYRPDGFERAEYEIGVISEGTNKGLPEKGKSAVFVTKDQDGLLMRIFNPNGEILFDKKEADWENADKIRMLKEKLRFDLEDDLIDKKPPKETLDAAFACAGIGQLGFVAEECEPDAFELEYFIPDSLYGDAYKPGKVFNETPVKHIRIRKEQGKRPTIYSVSLTCEEGDTEWELSRDEVRGSLPQYILGYSSGHNEILSLPFFKMRFIHFDEYRDKLIKKVDYHNRPEGRMIYLDDQFSQVILLCHFLFPSEAITRVFKDQINLEGFRCFRLIIRRFHRVEMEQAPVATPTPTQESKPKATVELTENLSGIIDKLIKCATTYYEDRTPYAGDDEDAHDLYLDYWIDDVGETRRAFHTHFADSAGDSEELNKAASALNLFHALQTLLTLNYYKVDPTTKKEVYESGSLYVNETIPTPASHERIARFKDSRLIKSGVKDRIYLKNLSDGEHQLLHTIGLCLLFRHKAALFLLDEPETHLNPGWRASYISTLRAALETDPGTKTVMSEVLLTSHSPFIISDCRKENVLVFEKNDEDKVEWHNPDFETFGASANAITIKVFSRRETIGNFALSKLNAFKQRLAANEDPDTLIDEVNAELGDSVEKVLFVNQALNRKEGK